MFGARSRGDQVATLQEKIGQYEADRKILLKELAIDDADEIIATVQELQQSKTALEAQVADLQQAADQKVQPLQSADGEAPIDVGADPRELVARISGFAEKIKTLNGNIVSLEDQLNSLYAEREVLEKELGLSDAQEIIAMFRSLDAQLVTMYATRETFERELGMSDASEIVACVRRVGKLAKEIEREVSFK